MKFIRFSLYKIRRQISPKHETKSRIWKNLAKRWNDQPNQAVWFRTSLAPYSMAVIAALVVVASFGTGAFAYTNPDITEGNLLYPVKRAIENVEEKLQFTTEAKAEFYLKKIERREAEKRSLEKRNIKSEKLEQEIDKVERKLEKFKFDLK